MSDVIQIPTRFNDIDRGLFVCGDDDWMLECDNCGRRMPPFEPLRGMEDFGLQVAREMAREEGWASVPARDLDICPTCTTP